MGCLEHHATSEFAMARTVFEVCLQRSLCPIMAWKQEVNPLRFGLYLDHADLCLRHMLLGVSRTEPERANLATLSESSPCLRKTAELFGNHPTLPSYVRKVWFDGYYQAKESDMMFEILHQCKKIEYLSIPWTALRHGTVADWSSLFGRNGTGPRITTLEIRATNLPKRSAATEKENHFDNNVLQSVSVDFTNLTSLRFFGKSKFMSITDKDLIAISCTANNLREIHVTYAPSLRPRGIGALVQSSQLSLEVLELNGISQMESEQTEQHDSYSHLRLSRLVAQCPLLRKLRLQSIRTCRDIFACEDVAWSGKVQIYIGVNSSFQVPQSDTSTAMLYQTLDQARCFMDSRTTSGEEGVEIEIFTSGFIFEPRCALVHGDFITIHTFRESWRAQKRESHRNVQMDGYVRKFPFCITEDEFKDGLDKGYVWL